MRTIQLRRIVVTGMGIVSSIGNNVPEVLMSLKTGRSGIRRVEQFVELGFASQVGGIPTLDPKPLIDRKAMRFHTQGTAWNHVAMDQAIKDAGLEPHEVSNPRTGIIMGSGGPSTSETVRAADIMRANKSPKKIGPFAVPKMMSSTASATLAVPFGIKGVNFSITSACSTSAHCIGVAAEKIATGKQDIIFVGGCEEFDATLSNGFDAMGAMATNFNEEPTRASRPYDRDRGGFVIAGGAGVVVLEDRNHARARGAKIYGELVGYGENSDGSDMVQPSGEGAVRCMQMALDGLYEYDDVGYINTHGTGTEIGDLKEIGAIREVFGDNIPKISATKALTGHSLGATGVQEAIYCLLMMQHGFIAASANIDNLDPAFEGVPIVRERIDNVTLNTVLSNSFGFGGTNATLVFAQYRD